MRLLVKLLKGLRRVPGFVMFCARWLRLSLISRADKPGHALLPGSRGVIPPKDGRFVIFAAADSNYLRQFGDRFVRSVRARCPNVRIHIHWFALTSDELRPFQDWGQEAGDALSYTWEILPASYLTEHISQRPIYYQCARFVRLRELVMSGHSVLALDIDSVVRGDLEAHLSDAGHADIGLMFRPKQLDPAKRVLASCFFAAPTARTFAYLDWVANLVGRQLILSRGSPKLDQIALYFAYLRYRRELVVWRIPQVLSDARWQSASVVWHAKGKRKDDPAFMPRDEL